jgi:3-hydroxybutyrate dehydrogenase
MHGKVALVTGGTGGIGFGIAQALAAKGANLMLCGIESVEETQQLCSGLAAETGVRVEYETTNVMVPDEISRLIENTRKLLGPIDILVNNAGIQHVAPIDEFPIDKWDAIIAINLSSAFHTCRLSVPMMRDNKWGRIINIGSAHSLIASPYKSAYVAAKHGLAGLTKTVATEVAEDGITVNTICPGYVKTPLVEKQIPATAEARNITPEEVVRDVFLARQCTKEFVAIDEVADLVLYLCSNSARSITGTTMSIDGGWTAH